MLRTWDVLFHVLLDGIQSTKPFPNWLVSEMISWMTGVTKLHPHEVTFLREYVDVLQALSHSIDLLQGEKLCYLGFLIPTILSLKSKLSDKLPHIPYTANIIAAVLEALDKRFDAMLSSHDAKWQQPQCRNLACVGFLQRRVKIWKSTGWGGNIFGIQGSLCSWDEHLCYGGNVLTSSRSKMSDEHVEQVLLLRYNRRLCPYWMNCLNEHSVFHYAQYT